MEILADSRLNAQVLTVEEAETLIRRVVKDELFRRITRKEADEKVKEIIIAALKRIKIPSLREVARMSLVSFYNRERAIARDIALNHLYIFLALLFYSGTRKEVYGDVLSSREARKIISYEYDGYAAKEIINRGVALDMYQEDYFRKYIKPTLDLMAKERAIDPTANNYIGRRLSLMARAELEVRYKFHQDTIEDFKKRGVKLVVVSTHADWSDRCFPWQGRVYSLDGTSGIAPDGRPYVPLETATNILTPNGKWYNGLFGFNCRHTMREYRDGLTFPTVDRETARREYAITKKQRAMEREIRRTRAEAETFRGIDPARYKQLKSEAQRAYKEYQRFSRKNGRAYFPSRTKII